MFPLPHLPSMEGACTIVIPSEELGYIANPWVLTDSIDKCFIYFVISIGIVNVVPKVNIITVNSTHGRRTPGQRPPSYCRHGLRAFLTIYSSIPLWFLCTKVNFYGLAVLNAASVLVAALRRNSQCTLHLQNHHHHLLYMTCYLFSIDYLLSSPLTIVVTLVSA